MFKSEQHLCLFRVIKSRAFIETDSRPQPKIERLTKMITEERGKFSPAYSDWFGKPVALLVVIRQCHVPMPCRIVGESVADVRVRIEPGWEMEIRKELILAVEEDAVATNARMN
jgi:hypothetical protein